MMRKTTKLTFEDEIFLRDLLNGVRKSPTYPDRYYNEKDKIICTRCYEISIFESKTPRKILAKYQRHDKYKETGEKLISYVCTDHCDDLDDDDELVFDEILWELQHNPDKYDSYERD